MWEEVSRAAEEDCGAATALPQIESLNVVYCQSWEYDDPPARLAERIGARPKGLRYSGIGGSVPQVLVSDLASSILAGRLDLALVVGGEALATVRRHKKAGSTPEWSHRAPERRPMPFDIAFHPAEMAHSVFQAYLTFAVFDNARRAQLGRGLDEHRARLGELLAHLSEVAASDPANAWFPIARTPRELSEVAPGNRMVAYPYAKAMVSMMDVDMAAAFLVASDAKADELGVPQDRRVYLRGWGYAEDPRYVAERRDLWRSAAMKVAARAALHGAGVGIDDVAHLDLYSCFASSISFAADALGLDHDDILAGRRPVSVTGGLPYHGGPGSNYMTHSLAALAERLRAEPGSFGLASGVGMHMTKHAYGLWSSDPGSVSPPDPEVLTRELAADLEVLPITDTVGGPGAGSRARRRSAGARGGGGHGGGGHGGGGTEATVASYTVLHDRDGSPAWGLLVCDLPDSSRCYARLEDPDALALSESEELVGRRARLTAGDRGLNLAHL